MIERSALRAKIVYFDEGSEAHSLADLKLGVRFTGQKSLFGGLRKIKKDIRSHLEPLKADLVVSDYLGYAFTEVAKELGLPTIVHMPSSIKGYSHMTSWMSLTHETTCACCGMVCLCPNHVSSSTAEPGFTDLFA